MKLLAFVVIALFAAAAVAQDKPAPAPEAAKEPAKEAAKPAPSTEAAKPATSKSAAATKKGSRRTEDARHCLEKTSNTEVIKCAEEYL
jgi:predicted outer membrane protein